MNHESFRNIVGRGVNDRDSVGITTVSINNNKTRFDDVRHNTQFGFQDVYNQNTVLNQESLRHSVGGSVNNRDSVVNTNTCINNNKRSLDEVGNNI